MPEIIEMRPQHPGDVLDHAVAFRAPLHWPVMGCLRIDPPPTAEMIWGALRGVAGVITVLAGAG